MTNSATAETFLLEQARGSTEKILGATRGLEGLVRQNPRRPIQSETRDRLRELAVSGQVAGQPVAYDPNTTIRMLAVQALMTAGDTDLTMIQRAARDDDWQVRRLVAGRLDLSTEAYAELGAALARDTAFQVRHDLIPAIGRLATRTGKCEPSPRSSGSFRAAWHARDGTPYRDLQRPRRRWLLS